MFCFDPDLPSLIPGQAAIDFQLSSSLGKQLTALFQTVIDFKSNIDYSKVPNTVEEHRKHRIREVNLFVKNSMVDKFKKIVSSETGLNVKKLFTFGGLDIGICGYFAVDLSFDDWRAALETQERITGTGNSKYTNDRAAVEDMKSMADCFDLKTGKIVKPLFGKNRQIFVNMYFDVNTAFLVEDFYPEKIATPLTAGEIAAIMMHEVGHALTVIEHSANMFVIHSRLNNYFKSLKTNKDLGSVLYALQEGLVPVLRKLASSKQEDAKMSAFVKRMSNTLIAGINGLNDLYNAEKPEEESWLYTIGSFTGNVLLFALITICYAFVNFCFFMYGGFAVYELCRLSYVDSTSSGDKASDTKTNYNNTFLMERWADEYVSRHGFGAELASGLNKIDVYFKYGHLGTVTSERLCKSTLFNCMCITYGWILDKVMLISYLDPVGYENQYQRVARVLQNTYGFFKNEEVPAAAVDQWIRSVEVIKQQMKIAKTISDTAVGKAFYNTLKNLTNPVRWFVLIQDGNLDRDTEILANRIDDMMNNPFYYQAAKLKSMR